MNASISMTRFYKELDFSVQILVILNLVPNIVTGGERIKCMSCRTADRRKGKKSVKEVLEVNYFFFFFK